MGAMHLARRGVRAMFSNTPVAADLLTQLVGSAFKGLDASALRESIEDAVGAVALTHDLGHPPFSHALEDSFHVLSERWATEDTPAPWGAFTEFKGAYHEFAGLDLLHQLTRDLGPEEDDDEQLYSPFLRLVLCIAQSDPDAAEWPSALHSIVAGQLDIDRLDYVMRDAQRAGTEFGTLDYVRLVDAFELHLVEKNHVEPQQSRFTIGLGAHARSAAESLLIQRAQSYEWIIFHHRVVASNKALTEAIDMLLEFTRADDRVALPEAPSLTVKEVFQFETECLNYIRPDLSRHGLTISAPTPLPDSARRLRQASVDDGLVLRLLHDGLLAGETLIAEAVMDEAIRRRLERFAACARAVLVREKRLIPVWKTGEDWRRIALDVVGDGALGRELRSRVSELVERYEGTPGGRYIRNVGGVTVKLLARSDTCVVGANRVLGLLMPHARYRSALAIQLAGDGTVLRQRRLIGSWLIAHQPFEAIKNKGRPLVLYYRQVPEPLANGSPLVQALEQSEDLRVSTLAFYVVHDQFAAQELVERNLLRNALRQTVRDVLPEFVRETWPKHLENIAERLNRDTSGASRGGLGSPGTGT